MWASACASVVPQTRNTESDTPPLGISRKRAMRFGAVGWALVGLALCLNGAEAHQGGHPPFYAHRGVAFTLDPPAPSLVVHRLTPASSRFAPPAGVAEEDSYRDLGEAKDIAKMPYYGELMKASKAAEEAIATGTKDHANIKTTMQVMESDDVAHQVRACENPYTSGAR
jgi:hypothetical protein